MNTKNNDDEKNVLDAFYKGKLKKTKNASKEMDMAVKAADNYLTKDTRINIRLSAPDLKLLKRRAAEEGLPYQTLIASVLHKFVTGRLRNTI
ncbi:antitoxin [bacterium]|nr:antitoxin [bacterium]